MSMNTLPHRKELPDLPTKLTKSEAKITPKVLAWFRENHEGSCAIEIKSTSNARISRDSLKEHQKIALLDASTRGIVHKIRDAKVKNPFDAFMLKGVPAYVVACFIKQHICLVIPVEDWQGAFPEMKATFRFKL